MSDKSVGLDCSVFISMQPEELEFRHPSRKGQAKGVTKMQGGVKHQDRKSSIKSTFSGCRRILESTE